MGYEIYYTSAPQGLRPQERGFCTVAATPGLPKPLWERLESLSAYRHVVEPGRGAASNPVCLAHSLLHVSGKSCHVLSRIADSGLDYTQRTNFLAHHLVLEEQELAAAGPAWMLAQPGVMLDRWDGQPGPIVRTAPLPRGDALPVRCSSWERMVPDAGWAGILAETLAKSPWKPLALIFDESQDPWPLVQEVIALLPPQVRWQVTFNTYFTSLPSNAVCHWRCCLAQSPAAVAAARYAAAGVVIDLTHPEKLGTAVDGPWVRLARTGNLEPGLWPAVPVPIAPAQARLAPPPRQQHSVMPIPLADEVPALEEMAELQPAQGGDYRNGRVKVPLTPVRAKASSDQDRPPTAQADLWWMEARRRTRKRRLLVLYGMAFGTLLAGVGLWFWGYSLSSSDRGVPVPPPLPASSGGPVGKPPPVVVTAPPQPAPPAPTKTVPNVAPRVSQTPASKPVIIPPRPAPSPILLEAAVPAPVAGTGLRDMTQTLDVPASQFDDLAAVTSLAVVLPGATKQLSLEEDELTGSFTVSGDSSESRPGAAIQWQDTMDPRHPAQVLLIHLNKERAQLEFTWRTSILLRRPRLSQLAYWLLQNSTLVAADVRQDRPQSIQFRSLEFTSSLAAPALNGALPSDLPLPLKLAVTGGLPKGWQVMVQREPSPPNPPAPPAPPTQVLRFERRAGDIVGSRFTIRFQPDSRALDSDLPASLAAARAALAKAQDDCRHAADDVSQIEDGQKPGMDDLNRRLGDLLEQKQRAATQPADALTSQQLQSQIDLAQTTIQMRLTAIEQLLAPLRARLKQAQEACRICDQTLAGYAELRDVDLVLELPPGLRVATLHLRASPGGP